MQIGPYRIDPPLVLAPMAGVTDRPFRALCRGFGAGLAVSEMISSDPSLWDSPKSRLRRQHGGESEPIAVQVAGSDPRQLADAARREVAHGAQIIDINMGCPAKKVCRRDAGSALLADERLVGRILEAVVAAAGVPVTLKIRTGVSHTRRNGVTVARLAEAAGIAAIAVHGRTREDHFEGVAEHHTVAQIKQTVSIPVIVNGDITSAEAADALLRATDADALMIGRAAQGRPWIFRELRHFLATGRRLPPPAAVEVGAVLLSHLDALYGFYGTGRGVRVARKHIQWYCRAHPGAEGFWRDICRVDDAGVQRRAVAEFFGMSPAAAPAAMVAACA